jgi:Cys-tRNA(Pro) deacylase
MPAIRLKRKPVNHALPFTTEGGWCGLRAQAPFAVAAEPAWSKFQPIAARDNIAMAKRDHVSETPATQLLKANKVAYTEHPYEYLEHGGAQHSAQVLGFDPFAVVKTLVMQDQDAKPLLVLMHGNRKVSTKNLTRQIGAKSVEPCAPEVANRHSGYLVGGTSPFGTRRAMPVYIEESILALPKILINGGRRGYLVGIAPDVCVQLLAAKRVQCALAD